MRLSVPAGTIDTAMDRVRIMVGGWSVRNDGSVEGWVGGRLLLQLAYKVAGVFIREDTIIDGGWTPNLPVTQYPAPRLFYTDLNAIVSPTDPRRQLVWDPMPYRVRPGETAQLSYNLLVGLDLLAGMTEIDIVAIAERLDGIQALSDAQGHESWRWSDAFSVAEPTPDAPAAFTPVLLGQPSVQVNPF